MKYNPKKSFSTIKESLKKGEIIEVKRMDEYIFRIDLALLDKKYATKIQYKII